MPIAFRAPAAVVVLSASLLAFAGAAHAQVSYEVLHNFGGAPGRTAAPLLQASSGDLYGVTTTGGSGGGGIVFALTPGPGDMAFRTVHELQPAQGAQPLGALVEVNGEFVGTAASGGPAGLGTIFKITASQQLVVLHAFTGPDGANPAAGLALASDGHLYGTTYSGGANGDGTVFRLTTAGVLTTLHSFGGVDGARPTTPLVEGGDGALYGTTGGRPGAGGLSGTIFKITTAGAHTMLRSFNTFTDARGAPGPLTVGSDGLLYGSVGSGFPAFPGGVEFFTITTAGAFTPLHFKPNDATFSYSMSGALEQWPDGNFYGMLTTRSTAGGQYDRGVAFRLTPIGTLTTLGHLTAAQGFSLSGVVAASDGFLYGATVDGGTSGYGVVYRVNSAGALSTAYTFTGVDGESPWAAPVIGADGALYGTTVKGGASGHGTIYRLTTAGAIQTLHSFAGHDGAAPYGGVVAGNDGFLYGATSAGGCAGRGSIFRISTTGVFSTLHCFQAGEGAGAMAPLLFASDGHYYGTTTAGGAHDSGTMFRVSPGGAFATVVSFQLGSSGGVRPYGVAYPFSALVEAIPGSFVGTAALSVPPLGGAQSGGVFVAKADGVWASIGSVFGPGLTPSHPPIPEAVLAGVAAANDGSLYGVGAGGTVFRWLPGPNDLTQPGWAFLLGNKIETGIGSVSVNAISAPVLAADGSLIVVAGIHESREQGIYRITPGGGVSLLKVFSGVDGQYPVGLTRAPDGTLYGTTYSGGPTGRGVVFRLTIS